MQAMWRTGRFWVNNCGHSVCNLACECNCLVRNLVCLTGHNRRCIFLRIKEGMSVHFLNDIPLTQNDVIWSLLSCVNQRWCSYNKS
uniref:Uncharacterized protein n=1 Tax=Anguilla anguilla TaxID=7936 RepID=A0A0E9WM23_ANGAN